MRLDCKEKDLHRYLVLFSAISFLLLTTAVTLVYSSPMSGYEYSVYLNASPLFWMAVFVGLIAGMLLFHVHYGTGRRLWVVGLFQILLSNFVFMTLYLYRGFVYIQRNDSLTYVGYAQDIVQLGNIPSANFYPMGSLTMAISGEVIGEGMLVMSQLLPAIFVMAYTIGMLCWSRSITSAPGFVVAMMFASLPLFFAWFVPSLFYQTLCVLMLPFFFYLLWNRGAGGVWFKALTAMMIVFLTIGHPLVAIGALLFMVLLYITERLTNRNTRMVTMPLIGFSSVILLGWISFNSRMVSDLRNNLNQLMDLAGGLSTIGSAQAQASSLGVLPAVQAILACTVDDLIYLLMALWMGWLVLKSKWRVHPMTPVMACLLGGGAFILAVMAFTFAHNPFRMINLNFIMVLTVPLVGYLLYTHRARFKGGSSRIITTLILISLLATMLTAYQDPLEGFPNASVTRSELSGTGWFIHDQPREIGLFIVQTHPGRYEDMMYGAATNEGHYDLWRNVTTTTYHFGSFLNATNEKESNYLIFSEYDEQAYLRIWGPFDKYNQGDFLGLDMSSTVNHLYTNRCLMVYARS